MRRPSVYRLKISLDEIRPKIWRRVLVPGTIRLEKLHWVIQAAMGWMNSHLHEFVIAGTTYGEPDPEAPETKDEARVTLEDVAGFTGMKFSYSYDFGDDWRHTILVETIEMSVDVREFPRCVAGKRACPPEDCGGAPGYQDLLRVLGDPQDEEFDSTAAWVGEEFDPERCDVAAIDVSLALLPVGRVGKHPRRLPYSGVRKSA